MAEYDGMKPGQVLADASVAEFIKSLGLGIAEAQKALDDNSVNQIAEFIEPLDGLGGKTLLDLGLSPAFYHYQYADLSCSLQLSLKVQKNIGFGLNIGGSYSSTSGENETRSQSSSSSESGSSTRTETRSANIQITSASVGALSVGGKNFQLQGDTPAERMENLQNALTGDPATGIARVLYQLEPTALEIRSDAPADKVQTTSNTVAFLGGGFDSAVIRVGEDTDTDYKLHNSHTAATTAQGSLQAYADHVKTQIIAEGYDVRVVAPGTLLDSYSPFATGKHILLPAWYPKLRQLAQDIKQMNVPVEIQGFADRQTYPGGRAASDAANRKLGDNRAKEIKRFLEAQGAPANLLNIKASEGDKAAERAGNNRGQNNPDFRKADITTANRNYYLLYVNAKNGGPTITASPTPDKRGAGGTDNGFVALYKPSTLNLSGKKVTIDGTDFPFRGTAAGGHPENSPQAYAVNLAADVNGNANAGLKASATDNVVTISKDGDKFSLMLVTAEQRNINLSGSSGITVTEQFSRTSASSLRQQNTGNSTVAIGASLDVRYSRQFEMNVTGNSSISARLVAIPAPPQFLETIKEYLKE